jgi:hypothetical protein
VSFQFDRSLRTISTIAVQSSQRGEAATESRIISRKDAKAAKKEKKYLSELSALGALAGEMAESEMFPTTMLVVHSSLRKISKFEFFQLGALSLPVRARRQAPRRCMISAFFKRKSDT